VWPIGASAAACSSRVATPWACTRPRGS
jgi:hypothetical protein